MDENHVAYVDDEHVDNHDYDDNTDDGHDNNTDNISDRAFNARVNSRYYNVSIDLYTCILISEIEYNI